VFMPGLHYACTGRAWLPGQCHAPTTIQTPTCPTCPFPSPHAIAVAPAGILLPRVGRVSIPAIDSPGERHSDLFRPTILSGYGGGFRTWRASSPLILAMKKGPWLHAAHGTASCGPVLWLLLLAVTGKGRHGLKAWTKADAQPDHAAHPTTSFPGACLVGASAIRYMLVSRN